MALNINPVHIDALVDILANSAGGVLLGTPQEFFRDLVASAHLPSEWTRKIVGRWSGNADRDARNLVNWAIGLKINPDDPRYTALGALLQAFLRQKLSPEDTRTIVAILVGYNLIRDEVLLDEIRTRYIVPSVAYGVDRAAKEYGPPIEWRGPKSDTELQGFFSPDPPWQDVGFLRQAMDRSASVCRVEVGIIKGTGFLIAPTLVLTNYHVLQAKEDDDIEVNARKAVLRFGYFATPEGDASKGRMFKVNQIVERSGVQALDFVLLEIEANIQAEESIQPVPFELKPPPIKSALNILHHPGGDVMKLSTSSNGVTGVYEDRNLIQYVTRAVDGSSGSPCFNDDWKVVALHHSQRTCSWGSVREGILIRSIHEQIQRYL